MARSSRRHLAGLIIATQDTADLPGSDLGRAVIHNAATKSCCRDPPRSSTTWFARVDPPHGKRDFLLRAGHGHRLPPHGGHGRAGAAVVRAAVGAAAAPVALLVVVTAAIGPLLTGPVPTASSPASTAASDDR